MGCYCDWCGKYFTGDDWHSYSVSGTFCSNKCATEAANAQSSRESSSHINSQYDNPDALIDRLADESNQLQSAVWAKNEKIQDLENQNSNFSSQINSLECRNSNLEDENYYLQEKINEYQKQIAMLQAQLANRPKLTGTCDYCGKEIYNNMGIMAGNDLYFCSKACHLKFQNEFPDEYNKNVAAKDFQEKQKSNNYSVWQNFVAEHHNFNLFKITKKSEQILFNSEYNDLINAIIPNEEICKTNNWNRTEDITKFKNLHTQFNVTLPVEYFFVTTRSIYERWEDFGFSPYAEMDNEVFDQSEADFNKAFDSLREQFKQDLIAQIEVIKSFRGHLIGKNASRFFCLSDLLRLEWSNAVIRSELKNKFGINDFRNVFGYAVPKDNTKKTPFWDLKNISELVLFDFYDSEDPDIQTGITKTELKVLLESINAPIQSGNHPSTSKISFDQLSAKCDYSTKRVTFTVRNFVNQNFHSIGKLKLALYLMPDEYKGGELKNKVGELELTHFKVLPFQTLIDRDVSVDLITTDLPPEGDYYPTIAVLELWKDGNYYISANGKKCNVVILPKKHFGNLK